MLGKKACDQKMYNYTIKKILKDDGLSKVLLIENNGTEVVLVEKKELPFCNSQSLIKSIHEKLYPESLCPRLINEDTNIYEYLGDKVGIEVLEEHQLDMLGQAIKRLHSNQLEGLKVQLFQEKMKSYQDILGSNFRDPIIEEGFKIFGALYKKDQKATFCHNDLNNENIFFNDKCKFIDWDYACYNQPIFDLAMISKSFNLNYKQQEALLESYGDSSLSLNDISEFSLFISYLEYIWLKVIQKLDYELFELEERLMQIKNDLN